MGLLDKVKAIKNAVTGGAARVYLDAEELSFDSPFRITVRAQTDDAPVKISRVYVHVRGYEEVRVPDVDVIYEGDGDAQRRVETVSASNTTIEIESTIAEAQELEANQLYEWEAMIELPSSAPSVFKGRYCQHTYKAFAGLDCFGNDPDSGWIELYD